MKRWAALLLLLAAACSRPDTTEEVPPLPGQDANSTNLLMTEAQQAAGNAAARAETTGEAARSAGTSVNEVTP
jgi:hypothetical protein